MKKKRSRWQQVEYGKVGKFICWSAKVKGEGDETLSKKSSFLRKWIKWILRKWNKIIILEPRGHPERTFSVGFSTDDVTKISSATRKVKDGPFGMRMGPKNCYFFIASREGELELIFVEYVDINDKAKSKIPLY